MRHLLLTALIALAPGCKVFDQPKRVDGLEQRVDELADAVSKLVGEPVAQRQKPKAKAHDEEGDGEAADADPKARKARRPKSEARAGRDRGDRTAKAEPDQHRQASAKASHDDDPAEEPADPPADDHAAADDDHADAAEPTPPPAAHGAAPHWAYAGAQGPSHWGELDEQFAACGDGHEQSPIDILPKRRAAQDESVFFVYKPTAGEAYAMELHLVHKNKAGKLAVVGVLIADGAPSSALAPVWKQLPKAGGSGALKKPFDPSALLPSDTGAYRYAGSLTTPPCSEGVKWIVLRRTATDADKRIAAFRARFGANARPTQSLGERELQ